MLNPLLWRGCLIDTTPIVAIGRGAADGRDGCVAGEPRVMRLARAVISLAVAAVATAPAASADASEPQLVASLERGESAFWDGETVGGAFYGPPDQACDPERCWEYRVALGRGARLRVAIDIPMRDDGFVLEVVDPRGDVVASGTNDYDLVDTYNVEVFVVDPEPGGWTIRVRTNDATDSAFRLRAKLEGAIPAGPRRFVAPNLQIVPPFEFGFAAPANPMNGRWPPDDVNPPLGAAGVYPVSCAVDEMVEDGARRCLRFSAGPLNAGPGPLDLRLAPDNEVFQRIHYEDGSGYVERPAGTWEYHNTHGHNHYTDVLTYELFRVRDPETGAMEKVGAGHKSGFCPADQRFASWRHFNQAPAGSTSSDCTNTMGLSTGWGDIYRWQRPGQYVEFPQADGRFVVRATGDVHGWVLESDEGDNVGYAYIEVAGDQVAVLERGLGSDPWDDDKVVVRDWWERLG